MRHALRLLVLAPVLLVLIVFMLSNRQDVALGIWPTDLAVVVPLSIAVLVALAIGMLIGAVLVWGGALRHRRRAARAERHLRLMQAETAASRPKPAASQAHPGPLLGAPDA